ncbi:unnamed protein product [Calicophoron daubneyi]|uniref:Protein FAM136A n=1 Tax=Calicophoron daubneyi TaxID=300641 RepID=A0AAV2TLJ8_CALDB
MGEESLERDIQRTQDKYQETVQAAVVKLDREYLRKIQKAYFLCGARCCDDLEVSAEAARQCMDRCEAPLSQAHNLMQSELNEFQNRLQMCSTECANRARDKLKADAPPEQVKAAQHEAFKCAQDCVETQLKTGLPALVNRLRTQLQKLSPSKQDLMASS